MNTLQLSIALTITVSILTHAASGQTAKDYFIPVAEYNKASYYTPDRTIGNPTTMT